MSCAEINPRIARPRLWARTGLAACGPTQPVWRSARSLLKSRRAPNFREAVND